MYGDRRAIAPIRAALDRYDPDLDIPNEGNIEGCFHGMVDALEELGAPLTRGEREKYYLIIMEGQDRDKAAQAGAEIDLEYARRTDRTHGQT